MLKTLQRLSRSKYFWQKCVQAAPVLIISLTWISLILADLNLTFVVLSQCVHHHSTLSNDRSHCRRRNQNFDRKNLSVPFVGLLVGWGVVGILCLCMWRCLLLCSFLPVPPAHLTSSLWILRIKMISKGIKRCCIITGLFFFTRVISFFTLFKSALVGLIFRIFQLEIDSFLLVFSNDKPSETSKMTPRLRKRLQEHVDPLFWNNYFNFLLKILHFPDVSR